MICVVCTVNGRCLPVLRTSLACYAKGWRTYLSFAHGMPIAAPEFAFFELGPMNTATNFGDAYNMILAHVFAERPNISGIVLLNDDCVFTPDTARLLAEDVAILKARGEKIGLVACRADWIRPQQTVRLPRGADDVYEGGRWRSERDIIQSPIVAPVCAWLSREAFEAVKFPPLNQGSDDVFCLDLVKLGFTNWISRGYTHHVGAVHTGHDYKALDEASKPWVRANRPDYFFHLFGEQP